MNMTFKTMAVAAVAALTLSQGAQAQTQEELEAARALISAGDIYSISTEVGGTTYYLTAAGTLTAASSEAGEFEINQQTKDNAQWTYSDGTKAGWWLSNNNKYFTNPGGSQTAPEKGENIRTSSNSRNYEAQVFFYNGEKFAVRACNAQGTAWGANTYWDVDATAELPKACYNIGEDGVNGTPQYIWTLTRTGMGDGSCLNAAMEVLQPYTAYDISATVEGVKYYLTPEGRLSAEKPAPFVLKPSSLGDYKPNCGWFVYGMGDAVGLFTNPTLKDEDKVQLAPNTNPDDDKKHSFRDYETQVFYYNPLTDKYAVRCTNVNKSDWGANAYWNVGTNDGLPCATYDLDNRTPHYVWNVEKAAEQPFYIICNRFHEDVAKNKNLYVKSDEYKRTALISEAGIFARKATGEGTCYIYNLQTNRYFGDDYAYHTSTVKNLAIQPATAATNPDAEVWAIRDNKSESNNSGYINAGGGLQGDKLGLSTWKEDAGSHWLFVPIAEADMSVTIPESGYTTLSPVYAHVSIPEGVTVYTARMSTGNSGVVITPYEGTTIARGQGVIVAGEVGQTYTFAATDEAEAISGNSLVGLTQSKTSQSGASILADDNGKACFTAWADGTRVPAGSAYLNFAADADALLYLFFNDDDATGIQPAAVQTLDGKAYNMAGQRVSPNYRGIVVVGGKKVVRR